MANYHPIIRGRCVWIPTDPGYPPYVPTIPGHWRCHPTAPTDLTGSLP